MNHAFAAFTLEYLIIVSPDYQYCEFFHLPPFTKSRESDISSQRISSQQCTKK